MGEVLQFRDYQSKQAHEDLNQLYAELTDAQLMLRDSILHMSNVLNAETELPPSPEGGDKIS